VPLSCYCDSLVITSEGGLPVQRCRSKYLLQWHMWAGRPLLVEMRVLQYSPPQIDTWLSSEWILHCLHYEAESIAV